MSNTTNNVDFTKLNLRIDNLNHVIDEAQANGMTVEASQAAQERVSGWFSKGAIALSQMTKIEREAFQLDLDDSLMVGWIDERMRMEETLRLNLMHITSNWLITETAKLVSPAGFHPSDRVFIATDVQTNCETSREAMRYAADGSVPLYLHDMSVFDE